MRPRWIGLLAVTVTAVSVVRALTAAPAPVPVADRWWFQPAGQSTVDDGTGARVFALDPFTNPAGTVRRLHRSGRPVFCRLWAGWWESDRPDAARFGAGLLGNLVVPGETAAVARASVDAGRVDSGPGDGGPGDGGPGTGGTGGDAGPGDGGPGGDGAGDPGSVRWLDIRSTDALPEILEDRLILCAAKGFDGVALSAVDGYARPTGFALTPADQLAFNHRVAALAHRHRLRVAMIAGTDEPAALLVDADTVVRDDIAA